MWRWNHSPQKFPFLPWETLEPPVSFRSLSTSPKPTVLYCSNERMLLLLRSVSCIFYFHIAWINSGPVNSTESEEASLFCNNLLCLYCSPCWTSSIQLASYFLGQLGMGRSREGRQRTAGPVRWTRAQSLPWWRWRKASAGGRSQPSLMQMGRS